MHSAMTVSDDEVQLTFQEGIRADKEAINVLLVSQTEGGVGYLRQQLESRGCRCWNASSTDELTAMVDGQLFDLILSTSWLSDQTLCKLQDSQSTVFLSYPVRNGCWWLPVLERGRRSLGEPAFRSSEFGRLLGPRLRKIRRIGAVAA